jgi:protein gp37
MSDLFHEDIPDGFIREVFRIMAQSKRHIFQVLTKRADRLVSLSSDLLWPDNVWQGVSVENEDYFWRLDRLRLVPAKVKFVSFEPLLGPVHGCSLHGIDWAIVGGESGPSFRPPQREWIRDVRNKCLKDKVYFFFKQWGGRTPKAGGNLLDGKAWQSTPPLGI